MRAAADRKGRRRGSANGVLVRFANWASRVSLLVIVLVAAAGVVGFLRFSSQVASLENAGALGPADGIVVLTGGEARIETALDLLARGKGRRLLISGVHPRTTPAAIRDAVGGRSELFDCCIDMDRAALDTIGNAIQAGDWARRNRFGSLIVVTSNYHMPRSLLEMRHHAPDLSITPYLAARESQPRTDMFADRESLRLMASEYLKYLAAVLRLRLDEPPADAALARATPG